MLTGTGAAGASHQLVVAGSASRDVGFEGDTQVTGAVEGEGGRVQDVGVVGGGGVEPGGEAEEVPAERGLAAAGRVHALDVGQQRPHRPHRGRPELLRTRRPVAGFAEPGS